MSSMRESTGLSIADVLSDAGVNWDGISISIGSRECQLGRHQCRMSEASGVNWDNIGCT